MEVPVRKTIFAFLVCVVAASAAKRHFSTSAEGASGLILQQISQEPDGPRRLGYLEMFLERFPQHESFTWALGEAQPIYLAAKDFEKVIRAADVLLQADPADIYAAQNALKAAETKGDRALIHTWAGRAARSARLVRLAPPSEAIDYARQCEVYAEYILYAPALQSADPKLLSAIVDQIEKENATSPYLTQIRARLFQVYRQTGNFAKTLAYAEGVLRANPDQQEMLLFLASHYYDGMKDKSKAMLYSKRLVDPQTKADPGKAALGHVILGIIASQEGRYPDADSHLRAALPLMEQHPALKGEALYHLGLVNYQIGDPQQDMNRIQAAYKFHAQSASVNGPFQNLAASSAAGIRSQYHLK